MKPSASEESRWLRIYNAVRNPLSILDRATQGLLTVEEVNAVRTTSPETFRAIQSELVTQLQDLRGELNYQARLNLSTLFDVPVESTIDTAATIQQLYAAKQAQQPQPVQGVPQPPGTPTAGQRITER